MKRRVISKLIVLIMAFTLVYGFLSIYKNYNEERYISGELLDVEVGGYFSGSGTETSPYIISKKSDMEYLSNAVLKGNSYIGKNFIVSSISEIDLRSGFTGIGIQGKPFAGTFDGNGANFILNINRASENNVGLFNYVTASATIKNLSVSGQVIGQQYVGAIVGQNLGRIENVYSTANVTGAYMVGGIAGLTSGTIQGAYNTGEIIATGYYSGGIAGQQSGGSIEQVYSRGTAKSQSSQTYTGGVIGNQSGGTIKNAYYDTSVMVNYLQGDGNYKPIRAIGNAVEEKQVKGIYQNELLGEGLKGTLDSKVWEYKTSTSEEGYYPQLTVFTDKGDSIKANSKKSVLINIKGGMGNEKYPYLIKDKQDISELVNKIEKGNTFKGFYFKVVDGIEQIDLREKYTPIGTATYPFAGTFDGNGVEFILNLTTNVDARGLFAYTGSGAHIKNLSISGNVTGRSYVGGVVGIATGTKIENVYNKAIIKAGSEYAGGIVGNGINVTIENAYNIGDITASGYFSGGIIAATEKDSEITNVYSRAEIKGSAHTGGIIGYANNGLKMNNSYSTSKVSSSYSSNGFVGGIVGSSNSNIDIKNSYYDLEIIANYIENSGYHKPVLAIGNQGNTDDIKGLGTLILGVLKGKFSDEKWFITTEKDGDYGYYPQLKTFVGDKSSNKESIKKDSLESAKRFIGEGLGTENSPFIISNEIDMIDLQAKVIAGRAGNSYNNFYFKVADGVSEIDLRSGFTGIGIQGKPFAGTFDGNGANFILNINRASENNVGLFNYVTASATIKNLSVSGQVIGQQYVGAIVGQNLGRIENVYSTANVTGAYMVGGIAGLTSGTIQGAYNTGEIIATGYYSGGIAGQQSGGSIEQVYSRGTAKSPSSQTYTGGVIGNQSGGTIKNAYYDTSVMVNYLQGDGNYKPIRAIGNAVEEKQVKGIYQNELLGEGLKGTLDSKVWEYKTSTSEEGYYPQLTVFTDKGDSIKANSKKSVLINIKGGMGNEKYPYLIKDKQDISELVNKIEKGNTFKGFYFKVVDGIEQIDLREKYTPIGTATYPFAGTFDGNGVEFILNLTTNVDARGLFAYTGSGAHIKNLSISGNVTGKSYVGGVVGIATGTKIENVYNKAIIKAGSEYAGGIVGNGINVTIENAYNIGDITASGYFSGGIIAATEKDSEITNVYSRAEIKGSAHTGGIIGYANNGLKMNNSYSTSKVSSSYSSNGFVGGIVGSSNSNIDIKNSYYDLEIIANYIENSGYHKPVLAIGNQGNTDDIKGLGTLILGVLKGKFSDEKWFITTEKDGDYGYYPQLKTFVGDKSSNKESIKKDSLESAKRFIGEGLGTENSPFIISNEIDMIDLQAKVIAGRAGNSYNNFYFKVADGVSEIDLRSGFTGIGIQGKPFAGTFDGNGANFILNINRASENNVGLFNYVTASATIKNLSVSGQVIGQQYVGAIVGQNLGRIENVYSTANVTGAYMVGGIAGLTSGTIQGAYNTGEIIATGYYSGGIAGQQSGGSIEQVYSRGTAKSQSSQTYTGGVIGNQSGGTIKNAYYDTSVMVNYLQGDGNYKPIRAIGNAVEEKQVKGIYQNELLGEGLKGTLDSKVWEYKTSTSEEGYYPQLTVFTDKGDSIKANSKKSVLINIKGGMGNEKYPYLIKDKQDISELVNKIEKGNTFKGFYFKVVDGIEQIDLREKYTPIGTATYPFAGTFDGNGVEFILNLTTNVDARGLFAYTGSGAHIKNLSISGNVTGRSYVGGVVGIATGTKIENVYNKAIIKAGSEYAGGIVGNGINVTIENAYNIGDITASGYFSGGIIAATEKDSEITNVYSRAEIKGSAHTGGIIGYANNGLKMNNSYSTSKVSSSYSSNGFVGGIVGSSNSNIDIKNSYYDLEIIANYIENSGYHKPVLAIGNQGNTDDIKGLGTLILGVLKGKFSDEKWFITTEKDGDYGYYPQLKTFVGDKSSNKESIKKDSLESAKRFIGEGLGTENSPFIISNEIDMIDLQAKVIAGRAGNSYNNFYFKVADGVSEIDLRSGFTGIGIQGKPFAGTFDGNGANFILNINRASENNVGLFNYVTASATIKNLSVSGQVIGQQYVGAIVGQNLGRIENVYSTANVTGAYMVGGIAGLTSGTIQGAYNTGEIIATGYYSGGIAGQQSGGSIEQVYSRGTAKSPSSQTYTGGVIGNQSGGTIKNAYYDISVMVNYLQGDGNYKPIKAIGNVVEEKQVKGITSDNLFGENAYDLGMDKNWKVLDPLNEEAYYPQLLPFSKSDNEYIREASLLSVIISLKGGTGSENYPYIIYTNEDMNKLQISVAKGNGYKGFIFKVYEKNTVIDLRENYKPIGTATYPFAGTFDGNGVEFILNLTSNVDARGLFAYTGSGAHIKNLSISGNVTGKSYVGGVVGIATGTKIENVYNKAIIKAGSEYAGGIVGNGINVTIENAYNIGDITASGYFSGGIIAATEKDSEITNVYSRAEIKGSAHTGGIIGYANNGLKMNNSYSTSKVSSSYSSNGFVGGIVGSSNSNIDIKNSYYDLEIIANYIGKSGHHKPVLAIGNQGNTDDRKGLNTSNMYLDYMKEYNFNDSIWYFEELKGNTAFYPQLKVFTDTKFANKENILIDSINSVSKEAFTGDGTVNNPYLISNIQEMIVLRDSVNSGLFDTKNIFYKVRLNVSEFNLNKVEFTPIGTKENPFKGSFDGNYANFHLDIKGADYQALFGYTTSDATIKNLSVSGEIEGNNYVSSIVSYNEGIIENVYSTANVKGNNYVAGLIGLNLGDLKTAYNRGSINARGDYVGGLIGFNRGKVSEAFNGSVVHGNKHIGAVIGYNENGIIEKVYYDQTVIKFDDIENINKPIRGTSNFEDLVSGIKGLLKEEIHGFNIIGLEDNQLNFDSKSWVLKDTLGLYDYYPQIEGFANSGVSKIKDNSILSVRTIRFAAGAGTKKNPYIIRDENDMKALSDVTKDNDALVGLYFKVMDGVDKLDLTIPELDFQPIGPNNGRQFRGGFDGNNATIVLNINQSGTSYRGLFGYLGIGSEISNIRLEGSVTGANHIGALAGESNGSMITNIYNSITVRGSGRIGGIVGIATNTILSNVYNVAEVTGISEVGGILGYTITNSKISYAFNYGTIKGTRVIGGIIGNAENKTDISYVYNRGRVQSNGDYTGGITGNLSNGTLINSYNASVVIGKSIGSIGGLIGNVSGTTYQENSFYDTSLLEAELIGSGFVLPKQAIANKMDQDDVTGVNKVDLTGLNASKLTLDKDKWVFRENIGANAYYPELNVFNKNEITQVKDDSLESISSYVFAGDGDELSPYVIVNKYDMETLSNLVNSGITFENKHFKVKDNVEQLDLIYGINYKPIGSKKNQFLGYFDGKHTRFDVEINDDDYSGLFGYIGSGSVVKNLSVSGHIKGKDYVGSVAGYSEGIIDNVYSTSTIEGGNYVAGIVGYNEGEITQIYHIGDVIGKDYVAGIVGYNKGSISNGYVASSIFGLDYIGGVVGYEEGDSTYLYYNESKVNVSENEAFRKPTQAMSNRDDNDNVMGVISNQLYSTLMVFGKENLWKQEKSSGFYAYYPQLSSFTTNKTYPTIIKNSLESVTVSKFNEGKGIEADPYIIRNEFDMEAVSQMTQAGYTLEGIFFKVAVEVGEIDLTNLIIPYQPIGNMNRAFQGVFEGTNTQFKLNITGNLDYRGLFGVIGNKGYVNEVSTQGSVSGRSFIGGIAGRNYGKITNSYNLANLNATEYYVGGITGYHEGIIDTTFNSGNIKNTYQYAGGISGGTTKNSQISNSYNTGNVTSSHHYAGGIVGYTSGNIKNTYSSGVILSPNYPGGIAGVNNAAIIENSYYTIDPMLESKETYKATRAIGNALDTETVKGVYNNQISGDQIFGIELDMNHFVLRQSELLEAYYPQLKVFLESKSESIKKDSLSSVKHDLLYGEGIDNNEYRIYSAYDLRAIGIVIKQGLTTLDTHFKVIEKSNLDLETIKKYYVPMGTKQNPFEGNFNGSNSVVKVMIESSEDYQGLFGYTSSNATIKNMQLTGSISGDNYVGAVAGYNNATLENISSTANVIGKNYVGGIAGYNESNTKEVVSKGEIIGNQFVGGLFGYAKNTIIELSYFMGIIKTSNNYTGGLIGDAENVELINSFSYGVIESNGSYLGGIAGRFSGNMKNVYSQADITSNASYVGGIVGHNSGDIKNVFYSGKIKAIDVIGGIAGISVGTIENAYYNQTEIEFMRNVKSFKTPISAIFNTDDTEHVGKRKLEFMTGRYAVGQTVEQMDFEPTLYYVREGFDFTSYFPELKIFKEHDKTVFKEDSLVSITYNKIKGKGTEKDPYIVNDGYDMMTIHQYVSNEETFTGKYFKVADGVKTIDLTPSDLEYVPIGTNEFAFNGFFDGNDANFIIKLNQMTEDYRGIFHTIGQKSVVHNLSISGTIYGKSYVGSVSGRNLGTIRDVTSSVKIISTDGNDIGGIVGFNEGTIRDVINYESIETNGTYVGGISGENTGTILGSFNKGRVEGFSNIGGISGRNLGNITNVYNAATIKAQTVAGGITGETSGNISFSYNMGNITVAESIVGGITGISRRAQNSTPEIYGVYNAGIITSEGKDISQAGGLIGNLDGGRLYDAYHFGSVYANKESGIIIGTYINGSISRTYYDLDQFEMDKHPKLEKPKHVVYDNKYTSGIKGLFHGQMIGNSIGNTKNQMYMYYSGSFKTLPSVKENSFYPQITYFANHKNDMIKEDSLKSVTGRTFILGKGTKENPYMIRNESDWIALVQSTNSGNDYTNVYFKVHEIVDELNFMDAEEDYPFVPVGTLRAPFNGILDGNGINVKIKTADTIDYQALFGYLGEKAHIRNISVSGNINGRNYTAGIAGYNKGIIEQVYNQATINGNDYVAGIAGLNEGIIKNVYNHGYIKGNNYVAGIIGNHSNILENSYNSGVIYGKDKVGAIAGFIATDTIYNSYYDKTLLNAYRDANGYIKPNQATSNSPDSDTVKGLDFNFMTGTDSLGLSDLRINFKDNNGIWSANYNLSSAKHYPQLTVFSRHNQTLVKELSQDSTMNNIYQVLFDENKDNDTNTNISYVISGHHYQLYIPQKVGYKFTGWYYDDGNKLVKMTNEKGDSLKVFDLDENVKFRADYEIAYHSVTFIDGDGKSVSKIDVRHGYKVEAPIGIIPSKKSDLLYVYKYIKWDFDFDTLITTNIVIKPEFDAIDRYYTITYFDGDNHIFDTEKVEFESFAKGSKKIPTKSYVGNDAYKFSKWDFDFGKPITQSQRAYPKFERVERYYDVNFYNDNGMLIDSRKVEYLAPAEAPEKLPEKEQTRQYTYKFSGWDKDFSGITEKLDVFAQYEQTARKYTVTFIDGNAQIFAVQEVEFGKNAAIPVGIPRKAPKDKNTAYKFLDWDNSLDIIVEDRTLTAKYIEVDRYYEVIFYNGDKKEVSKQVVEYLESAKAPLDEITKSSSKEYVYEFDKWDKDFSKVERKLEIYPIFKEKLRPYKVYFMDGNNNVYEEQTVLYGQSAKLPAGRPTKKATGEIGYKFDRWENNYTNIEGETVVKSEFIKVDRYYYVTFLRDSMILKTEKVEYGFAATAPTNLFDKHPREDSGWEYYFVSWDKDFSYIEQNLTVKLNYKERLKQFKVTIIAGDSITTQSVEWGKNAVFPTNPIKSGNDQIGYKFINWDKDGKNIKEDTTITAVFEEVFSYYEVKFYDGDGKLIKFEKVVPGENATAPLNVSKTKTSTLVYVFSNWDKDFTQVDSNLEVRAQFKEVRRYYNVEFLDYEGKNISKQVVEYGKDAKLPTIPKKPSTDMYDYEFDSWDKDYRYIAEDKIIKPIFNEKIRSFEVIFLDGDNKVLSTQFIEFGKNAVAPSEATKTPTSTIHYIFSGWNGIYTNVTSNITIKANFDEVDRYYEVKFIGENRVILDTQIVEYGRDAIDPRPKLQAVTDPNDNTKVYAVTGWDRDFTNVKSKLEVIAIYNTVDRYYEVIFYDENTARKNELSRQIVEYGKAAIAPIQLPIKPGNDDFRYDFDKWSADFSFITSNLDIYGTYTQTKTKYTVTFLDGNGNVFDTQTVNYGKDAVDPGIPNKNPLPKEMYIFTGWKELLTDIKEDRVITPNFRIETRVFSVIFKDANGNTLREELVEYGKAATAPTNIPEKPSTEYITYVARWNKSFNIVTDDLVVSLYYEEIERIFKATFLDHKGDILKAVTGPYQTLISVPEDPEKPMTDIYRYVFKGWNPEFSEILTEDITYTPVFDEILRLYTVTFFDGNNKVFDVQDVPYGTSPKIPKGTPTKESTQQYYYVFRMWESTNFKFYQDTSIKSIFYRFLQQYKVTFVDENNRVLRTQMVEYGTGATAPDADIIPTKPQTNMYTYVFTGWDKTFSYITEDVTIKVVYTAALRKYTYTFYDDDQTTILKRIIGHYGDKIVAPSDPTKEGNKEQSYIFIGWNKIVADLLTEDVIYYAKYESVFATYKVSFINGDGRVYAIYEVRYGESSPEPNAPTKLPNTVYEYIFSHWIEDFSNITEDLEVHSVFAEKLREYTVTFIDYDGSTKVVYIEYGKSARGKVSTPSRKGYRFVNWDKDLIAITANLETKAIYIANEYDIIFHGIDADKGTMNPIIVTYEENISLPNNSFAKRGYNFIGWRTSEEQSLPTYFDKQEIIIHDEGLELYATWELVRYDIEYDLDGGTASNPTQYTVEDKITLQDAQKENYIFVGWFVAEKAEEEAMTQKNNNLNNMLLSTMFMKAAAAIMQPMNIELEENKELKKIETIENQIGYIKLVARYEMGLIRLKEDRDRQQLGMFYAEITSIIPIIEREPINEENPVYLLGVYLGQTIGNLRTNFVNDNLIFLDENGNELTDEDIVKTGIDIVIRSTDDPSKLMDRITIVLKGDVDGDGEITVLDYNTLLDHISMRLTLEAEKLIAALIDDDEFVDVLDYNMLLDHISRKKLIEDLEI